jgi:hypothetical protein
MATEAEVYILKKLTQEVPEIRHQYLDLCLKDPTLRSYGNHFANLGVDESLDATIVRQSAESNYKKLHSILDGLGRDAKRSSTCAEFENRLSKSRRILCDSTLMENHRAELSQKRKEELREFASLARQDRIDFEIAKKRLMHCARSLGIPVNQLNHSVSSVMTDWPSSMPPKPAPEPINPPQPTPRRKPDPTPTMPQANDADSIRLRMIILLIAFAGMALTVLLRCQTERSWFWVVLSSVAVWGGATAANIAILSKSTCKNPIHPLWMALSVLVFVSVSFSALGGLNVISLWFRIPIAWVSSIWGFEFIDRLMCRFRSTEKEPVRSIVSRLSLVALSLSAVASLKVLADSYDYLVEGTKLGNFRYLTRALLSNAPSEYVRSWNWTIELFSPLVDLIPSALVAILPSASAMGFLFLMVIKSDIKYLPERIVMLGLGSLAFSSFMSILCHLFYYSSILLAAFATIFSGFLFRIGFRLFVNAKAIATPNRNLGFIGQDFLGDLILLSFVVIPASIFTGLLRWNLTDEGPLNAFVWSFIGWLVAALLAASWQFVATNPRSGQFKQVLFPVFFVLALWSATNRLESSPPFLSKSDSLWYLLPLSFVFAVWIGRAFNSFYSARYSGIGLNIAWRNWLVRIVLVLTGFTSVRFLLEIYDRFAEKLEWYSAERLAENFLRIMPSFYHIGWENIHTVISITASFFPAFVVDISPLVALAGFLLVTFRREQLARIGGWQEIVVCLFSLIAVLLAASGSSALVGIFFLLGGLSLLILCAWWMG